MSHFSAMISNSGDDNSISTVEDLDPEPEPVGRRAWWRSSRMGEVALGLLLLIGVLGWAGFSWWQEERNTTNYEQAQQDETLRQWDQAFLHYSAASGYKDADARAASASLQILARNGQYEIAKNNDNKRDAVRVLAAARAVQTIEPHYQDVDGIAAKAQDQVYKDALEGSVVMRTSVQPQGLYYRSAHGWIYLRGSDRWSSILSVPYSSASINRVVYDVPGPDWGDRTPLPRLPFNPYSFQFSLGLPDKVGRRLTLAILPQVDEPPIFDSLQMSPTDYNFYICGEAGVWGIRYIPSLPSTVIARGTLNGFVPTYEQLSQQASSATTPAPVTMPGTDGVVADFGHSGTGGSDSLLLAAHSAAADSKGITQLFLTGADGSGPRIVFSTADILVNAILSPDDRHALVVTLAPTADSAGKQPVTALLLTLDGSAPDRTLQTVQIDRQPGAVSGAAMLAGRFAISGVFLENGAFKNRLLLGWADNESTSDIRIRLLDVDNPDSIVAEATVLYTQIGALPVLEQPDGRTLLIYNQGVPPVNEAGKMPTSQLEVLRADPVTNDVKISSYNIPIPTHDAPGGSTSYLMDATLHGESLVYTVEAFTTQPESSDIYRLILPDSSDQDVQPPALIFSDTWSGSPTNGEVWPPPSVAGSGAYGYVDDAGTLYAHSYDADGNVPLETGVASIFVLNANYFYKVLH